MKLKYTTFVFGILFATGLFFILILEAQTPDLSAVVTETFIRDIEDLTGAKIEYLPGHNNDYTNCQDNGQSGKCEYWFMKEGSSAESDPSILSFEIEKAATTKDAKRGFDNRQRKLVGWASTDKGDRPLTDESTDISISGYSQIKLHDSYYRKTVLALIECFIVEIDCVSKIEHKNIVEILESLQNKISN